ncbi:hypothetical protein AALD01_06775 [Oscillospiraceae bacterium 21-37]|uniref:hypothetical protein n=1 Tax=Acutalibacter sp. JLR.KK004 TaxID=3112622 RepID=UPI002FF38DE7
MLIAAGTGFFAFFQGNSPAGKKVYHFASGQDKQIYPKHRVKALLFGGNSGKIIQTKSFQIGLLKSIHFKMFSHGFILS